MKNRKLFALSVVCFSAIFLHLYLVVIKSRNMSEFRGTICETNDKTTLEGLCDQVERIRNELLLDTWSFKRQSTRCESSNVLVADAQSSNYFETLERFPEIRTVFCEDSLENIAGYLRPKYYHYMSNDCKLLENKSRGGHNFGKVIYGAECWERFDETWHGHGLQEVALGVGLPRNAKSKRKDSRILTFIHIIPDATSINDGNVLHGHLKIVPLKCGIHLTKSCPKITSSVPKYKEVFTISQYWGNGFYHAMLEDLPRMAPYLTFLQKSPQIQIHVASKLKLLHLLGIDSSRLITAPIVHADILYMPPGGPCGTSPLFNTQLLANLISDISTQHMHSKKRDVIILIKRSHKRWFANHKSILKMLQRHASRLNLTVEVFADDPLPSMTQTPHGAGEANLILSQPGTLLIEGLCYDGDNMANLCYRNMAQALGLRYYGLLYRHQCMKITPEQIERPLMEFLSRLFQDDVTTF